MINAQAKGARGEREAAELLTKTTGYFFERRLREGRSDDQGDLDNSIGVCVQVKNMKNANDAFAACRRSLPKQFAHADWATEMLGMFKLPRIGWLTCFPPLEGAHYRPVRVGSLPLSLLKVVEGDDVIVEYRNWWVASPSTWWEWR